MNEVSTVSSLIFKLIAFAICLGCAGTLYDHMAAKGKDARSAIANDQMSYLKWNKKLHRK